MSKNSQMYAVQIEYILSDIFNCSRRGVGGIVNSDYISHYPIHTMLCGFTYLFGKSLTETEIKQFFEKYSMYAPFSIDDFLKSDGRTAVVRNCEYTFEKETGELQLKDIIEQYQKIWTDVQDRI